MARTTARVLAGVFAASALILPGFGVIDLSVTWSSSWPEVLEAGWGLFATVLVGAAFALAAFRPQAAAPYAQLAVATGALAVSAAAAKEPRVALLAAGLAVETAVVAALALPARPRRALSQPVLALAVAGAVPWLLYALEQWGRNRERRPGGDITLGIDHYSVQGALALSLAVLPFVAGWSRQARPFVGVCSGAAAAYLGIVALAWPHAAGAPARGWSAAAVGWGLALAGVANERGRRMRGHRPRGRSST